MPTRVSWILVAAISSIITLCGSSLMAAHGQAALAAQCGVTAFNPCPSPPLLLSSPSPGTPPQENLSLTLPKGQWLVWLQGSFDLRDLDPGTYALQGCVVFRDQGTSRQRVVLEPFKGLIGASTPGVATTALGGSPEAFTSYRRPEETPGPTPAPALGEINALLPYRPVLVAVPLPSGGKPTNAPPGGATAPPTTTTLTADCKVQIIGEPRAAIVAARLYALRVGS